MKIEVKEFVLETFIVEVPDDTPEDELDAAVEALRVQYTGERSSEVTSTDWEAYASTNEEVAALLTRYRTDHPDVRSMAPGLSQQDLTCWDLYTRKDVTLRGLNYSYRYWLEGYENHSPQAVAKAIWGDRK